MQTLLYVSCRPGESLRDRMGGDGGRLEAFSLRISEQKRMGRAHGWSKIHSRRHDGVINVHWDKSARLLVCRLVTRSGNPRPILGDFTGYLVSRFRKRIRALTIVP